MTDSRPTLSYGVLLYPGFGVLDIAGPLEVLNTLSGIDGQERMTLSIVSKTMDPINLGSPGQRGLNFKSKQQYLPTHTFDNAPNIDVLLVPGGWGSLPPADMSAEVDFIRNVYRGNGCPPLQYLFTICTGSALAAQAGVLDGHRATTNKETWKVVTPYGPKTYWVGQARWVVSDNIWTTSGVSAGTDGMVAWVAHVFSENAVKHVVNSMEYNREENSSNDPFSEIYDVQDVPPLS